jgi:hypothetical protein
MAQQDEKKKNGTCLGDPVTRMRTWSPGGIATNMGNDLGFHIIAKDRKVSAVPRDQLNYGKAVASRCNREGGNGNTGIRELKWAFTCLVLYRKN